MLPTHLLGLVAFFMLVLVENGRIPIDNPSGTIEISMIEEGRVLEYSGREYALVKWGWWMKLFLLSSIFMNVFVIPWGLGDCDAPAVAGCSAILALLGKLAVCGLVIVVIDSSFAKLRFFRIAEYLGAAFLLALVGIATSYVLGSVRGARCESLSATSPAGVLLDMAAVLILLCALRVSGLEAVRPLRDLLRRAVDRALVRGRGGRLPVRPRRAVGARRAHVGDQGHRHPVSARHFLIERFELKRDVALSTGLSTSLIFGGVLTAFAYLVDPPGDLFRTGWSPRRWCRSRPR